jgi:hypothetical protein
LRRCRRCSQRPPEAARRHSRRGPRRQREFQLRNSRLQTRWTTACMVCCLETPQQPLPNEPGDQARLCGRAQGIRDLEGDDSISTNQAATSGSCEATREGTYRRVTKQGQGVSRPRLTRASQLPASAHPLHSTLLYGGGRAVSRGQPEGRGRRGANTFLERREPHSGIRYRASVQQVERTGIEPATPCLQSRCSPS